jgi:CO/xanthine dehydrogenase FAD-binding subunit
MTAAPYAQPTTLAEVTTLLAAGGWAVLAGGTDLYPSHVGRSIGQPLVDITRVPALRGIRRDDAGWFFGATTTWAEVQRADLPPGFDALKQAAREVGGVQIQNTGTLAGNLCNASPAADGTPVWMALDAVVVLQSAGGERRVPVVDFVLANRRTARAPHELVVGLHVPLHSDRARSVFVKLGGRRYLTISMTMVAVVLEPDGDCGVATVRAAVGSCSARAQRLPALESRLRGLPLSALPHITIGDTDLAPLSPIDDVRATASYRRDATATLLRRAIGGLAA